MPVHTRSPITQQTEPRAFVAMKFGPNHWKDKKYIAIREELEVVGYKCTRADEIRTSGAVVDEVCKLLRDAELVVIDSSGDSHSVSYEIGYCHGIGRSPDTTLLLRDNTGLPFNYQHYRHRVYRDLRHLRRLIRDYLGTSEPLSVDQYGYVFGFEFKPETFDYILHGAYCVFEALREAKFSGRCECYAAERFEIPGRIFTVGVMLRCPGRKPIPDHAWWRKLQKAIARHSTTYKDSIKLADDLYELARKRTMIDALLPRGVAEFSDGDLVRLVGSSDDSFLRSYLENKNGKLK